MKKIFKRSLAVLLAVVMIIGAAPLSGLVGLELPSLKELFSIKAEAATTTATEPEIYENTDLVYGSNGTITRIEWLHNLTVLFEMTVSSDNLPDNYFFDLDETSEYYKDAMLAVEFGVIDIPAGGNIDPTGTATREFAAQTLNFCLGFTLENSTYTFSDVDAVTYDDDVQIAVNRGWFVLSNGKFNPEQAVTTAEVNKMIADTQAVLAESVIDYDKEDSFEFADDVVVIPQGTYVEITDTQVSILNCPVEIKTGDIFAVFPNDLPIVCKAVNVEKSNSLYIISVESYEGDVATSVEASGSIEVDMSQFVPADGIEVVSLNDEQPKSYNAKASDTIDLNKGERLDFGDEFTIAAGTSIWGYLTLSNLELYYDISTKNNKYNVVLDGDAHLDIGAKTNLIELLGEKGSFVVGEVPVAGGLAKISVIVYYDLSGEINYVGDFKISLGFNCVSGDFRIIKNFKKEKSSLTWNVEADVSVGVYADVNILYIVDANMNAKLGVKAVYNNITYDDGKTPENCVTMRSWFYANANVNASIGIFEKEKYSDSVVVFDENNSPVRLYHHFEDDVEVTKCKRTGKANYYTSAASKYGYAFTNNAKSYGYDSLGNVYTRFEYTLDDNNQATITKYYGNSYSVFIPKTIDGYEVVAIGDDAFKGNSYLVSVVIPDTVTEIGNSAFENCANLSSVQLSKNIEIVKTKAFGNCDSLVNIEIPKSLDDCTNWSAGPFYGCDNLNNVVFEEETIEISYALFSGCTGLKSITIPDTVTKIEDYAFYDCKNLKTITLSENLLSIGKNSFANCVGLSSIDISNSVELIGESAFYNCIGFSEIIIPDSVTEISDFAFEACINLSSVQLSHSLKTLGRAFKDCTALTSIEIPKSLDECGWWMSGPFENCTNLTNVTFEEGTTEISYALFSDCTGLKAITIPDTVTKIEDYAFYDCKNLKTVALSENLLSIGKNSFANCVGLSSIVIPNSVEIIGESAFYNCIGFSEIIIPDSVTEISDFAFEACTKLSSVQLSKSLKKLGRAFKDCTALTEIEIPKSLDECGWWMSGPFENCTNLTNVTFEEGTTEISYALFSDCTGLKAITIPDTVTKIEDYAFYDCQNLESIVLSSNILTIGEKTFYNCTSLETVIIPSKVQSVNSSAFSGCTSLKSAEFKNADTAIGAYAFDGCSKLETVKLPENLAEIENYTFRNCKVLKNINFPEKLTSIGQYAFYECDALTKAVIPDNVTSLGKYAFYGCENLSEIDFGIGLTTIPDSAFRLLPSLTEVYLPRFLTAIAANAFAENTKLTEVTVPSTVTSIKDNSFSYPTRLTFYGISDSYAETYANDRNISFIDVSELKIDTIKFDESSYVFSATGTGTKFVADMTIEPKSSVEPITFASSDTSIATVSNGLITVKGYGTATIIATTESGKTATCQITINRKVTGVTLNKSSVSIKEGSTAALTATVKPTNATNKNITWSSTDTTVATVSSDGVVTAVAPGTATIIVKTEDGAYTANCIVTVTSSVVTLDSITIKSKPSKTTYAIGESLNTSGLILAAKYSDGSSRLINSGFTCSPLDSSTAGTKTVTVSYGGKTTTFTVTVSATATPDNPSTETYTVKWIVDGNTTTHTYKEGDSIVEPANPSKSGYTFKGWTPSVPSTMPACDLTFTAVFEEISTPSVPVADIIQKPSTTTISYGDAIILHVDASKIPAGGRVEWTADNGNFSYSANGNTCKINPNKSGSTTFTATIYDAQGNAVSTDTQSMTSKAGFFDKLIAFFKKLFGLTKTIPQIYKGIF